VLEGGIVQIDDLALRRHAGEGGQGKQGEREGVARARHRDFKLPVACGARVEMTRTAFRCRFGSASSTTTLSRPTHQTNPTGRSSVRDFS